MIMYIPKLYKFIEYVITIMLIAFPLLAQNDTRVSQDELKKTGINYYNYSDPGKINIEIIVIGGVKNPGKYLVPEGTTAIDILSLAGAVLKEETSDNIKLIRNTEKSGKLNDNNIISLAYRDLFKDEQLKSINKLNPILLHGDILAIPITPEKTFWDNFRDVSSVVTPLVTLGTLIISIISLSKK